MIASQDAYVPPDIYLKLEEQSPTKHEYIDGYVYAMAGANDPHVTIALNMAMLLRKHTRGSRCRVYISDMKARMESINRFYYPDVMVTCDQRDQTNSTYKRYPRLIVEVLSDFTEAFDRGDKFTDYRTIESLQEYVLINTKRKQVECFRRNEQGLWILQVYLAEDKSFRLNSLGLEAEISTLYEDVTFV